MRWRGLLQSLALVVATLVATELVVRAVTWTPTSPERIDDGIGSQRYAFHPGGAGDLIPGQDGHWLIWHHRPYHVETNSLGLRSREEPIDGALRILATGDSQTFGPYVPNEDAWPGWLQTRLRRVDAVTRPIQVFNAAVSGYSIVNQLDWLKQKAIAFKPDLVLLAVFENDVGDLRKHLAGVRMRPDLEEARDDRQLRQWIKRVRKSIGENLATYKLVKDFKTQMELRSAGVDTRRGEGEATRPAAAPPSADALEELYARLFREFVAAARTAGIAVAVISIPDTTAVIEAKRGQVAALVDRLAAETNVPFLDLLDAFTRRTDAIETLYLLQWDAAAKDWRGNGHLSREGHRVVGVGVAEWLHRLDPSPIR